MRSSRRALPALLLLAAATEAFVGAPPLRCRVKRGASDRDGDIEDADEAARVAAFRARLMSGGLDAVAKTEEPAEAEDGGVDPEWARKAEKPATGVVLIGNKDWFFAEKPSSDVKAALKRVGLASDAAQKIPDDRLAGLVPVVLILEGSAPKAEGFSGVLMGRRSGYMMGDLKELYTTGFMLQPLWVGGPTVEDAFSSPIERTVGAPEGAATGIVAALTQGSARSQLSSSHRASGADIASSPAFSLVSAADEEGADLSGEVGGEHATGFAKMRS